MSAPAKPARRNPRIHRTATETQLQIGWLEAAGLAALAYAGWALYRAHLAGKV